MHEELIREVMGLALSGDGDEAEVLRAQYAVCSLASVEESGKGFFAEFDVPGDAPRLADRRDIWFSGGVSGDVEHKPGGVGFTLNVVDGVLKMLEGYTYVGDWPVDDSAIRLRADGRAGALGRRRPERRRETDAEGEGR